MSDTLVDDDLDARLAAPTSNIVRSFAFRAAESSDGLTLEGYGAVFGSVTEINSYEGHFTEEIAPGAFKRSLGDKTPVLQFDHGQHPLIGSMPIGVIKSIGEDSRGLKIRARLSDNWLIHPVRDAIRDGAVTGMSFRFHVPDGGDVWSKRGGLNHRTVTNVDLLEVGPVVWPAYTATSVGVRSRDTLAALQDPEVRAEIARLLASGADIESLAVVDALPFGARDDLTADLAAGRSDVTPTPTRESVRARLALAFADL